MGKMEKDVVQLLLRLGVGNLHTATPPTSSPWPKSGKFVLYVIVIIRLGSGILATGLEFSSLTSCSGYRCGCPVSYSVSNNLRIRTLQLQTFCMEVP